MQARPSALGVRLRRWRGAAVAKATVTAVITDMEAPAKPSAAASSLPRKQMISARASALAPSTTCCAYERHYNLYLSSDANKQQRVIQGRLSSSL